jgi:alpha,alpha-trehalase
MERRETGSGRFPPQSLREYAVIADGERGALIGPNGEIGFLCVPSWHDDAVFTGLYDGPGRYAVTPRDPRHVWGGHYDQDTLVWRSRWVASEAIIECREALALPADADRAVVLRCVEAVEGTARVRVELAARAGFGEQPMEVRRVADDVWEGRTGDLRLRWSGAPASTRILDGALVAELDVPEGGRHDLVLEIGTALPDALPDPGALWERTMAAWDAGRPDLSASAAPGESLRSHAVLRGLTSRTGGMVAAVTTSLPERADQSRNYDYRYAWIRDQCYTGIAAACVGDDLLLDAAVRFVTARVHEHGPELRPAYTVAGGAVPSERAVDLPGYPGAPVRVGNRVNEQTQLDVFGEALQLLAAADGRGRLDDGGRAAVGVLIESIRKRWDEPDAGIWELDDQRWAHSRLECAAGLRAVAAAGLGPDPDTCRRQADRLVAWVQEHCRHRSGRWQRHPDDERVDAALLLAGVRGAVPASDPTWAATVDAVVDELGDDGYVYRFRQDADRPLHAAEGAFVLCGLHLSLAELARGRPLEAARWYERNRSALGPPGLYAEEYDVEQRQLRGNLPQAFVHALLLETGRRLYDAGVDARGFTARDR